MKIAFGLVAMAVVAVLQQVGFAAAVVQNDPPSLTIDWTQVLVIVVPSVVTGFVTVMLAVLTLKTAREAKNVAQQGVAQSVETHKVVNSRMEEMLRLVRDKSLAEGKIEGQESERAANLTDQVAKTAENVARTAEQVAERVMSKEPQEVVVVKPAEVIVIKPTAKPTEKPEPEPEPEPEKSPPA